MTKAGAEKSSHGSLLERQEVFNGSPVTYKSLRNPTIPSSISSPPLVLPESARVWCRSRASSKFDECDPVSPRNLWQRWCLSSPHASKPHATCFCQGFTEDLHQTTGPRLMVSEAKKDLVESARQCGHDLLE